MAYGRMGQCHDARIDAGGMACARVWHVRVVAAEMARTQKNKATSFHLGVLKAKLAKLKRELIEPKGSGGGAKPGEGFDVTKSGDARVGLIGTLATYVPPSGYSPGWSCTVAIAGAAAYPGHTHTHTHIALQ